MGERPRYVVVEGPIGVGKTTLTRLFVKEMGGRVVLERTKENPFLERFYEDRSKYAFQTQLFFLLERFQQQRDIHQHDLFQQNIFSDYLFARDKIFASVNLDPNELSLYFRLFDMLSPRVLPPDLVVYLQATPEVLLERIHKRNNPYERPIDLAYLSELTQAFNRFFFSYEDTPLLVVNMKDLDFVERASDFANLVIEIEKTREGTRYLTIGKGVSPFF